MIEKLALYFSYPFVRNAFIVGVLIALCAALLGVALVLKRFSFIGDGLSHVAFGAVAVATVLNMSNNIFLVAPVTVLCAVLLLRTGKKAKISGDAAVAVLSVGALGLGYLLMNLFASSANLSGDVCSTLFGSTSILTLRALDVWICMGMSVLVVFIFLMFYHKIFAVTFDAGFATATGIKAEQYNMVIAVTTALVVVLAMNLVGSLLTTALIIFPALSAMRLLKSFRAVVVFSALFSIVCATLGILISILAGTPIGATIVTVDMVAFLFCSLLGLLQGGKK